MVNSSKYITTTVSTRGSHRICSCVASGLDTWTPGIVRTVGVGFNIIQDGVSHENKQRQTQLACRGTAREAIYALAVWQHYDKGSPNDDDVEREVHRSWYALGRTGCA